MGPHLRTFAVVAGAMALAAFALATSCFQSPSLGGPYLCNAGQACPAPYTCDDGLCCIDDAGAVPECPSTLRPDGRCTDGGTPRFYFQDLDQDGYGANDAGHLSCQPPLSYHFSLDAGDCDDSVSGAAIHPGAPDVCDGKDNDCNGRTDEPPACGGPASLFLAPGMTVGAKNLTQRWFSVSPPRCLRDDPADATNPDAFDQSLGTWRGSRSTASHVFWMQAPPGSTWDLRAPGKSLRLAGTVTVQSANDGATPPADIFVWYPAPQPWIMLCGPAGFLRLALTNPPGQSVFPLNDGASFTFDDSFLVRGDGRWEIQPGSSSNVDTVLAQVEHVEVVAELEPASGGPSFAITFNTGVMGFQ